MVIIVRGDRHLSSLAGIHHELSELAKLRRSDCLIVFEDVRTDNRTIDEILEMQISSKISSMIDTEVMKQMYAEEDFRIVPKFHHFDKSSPFEPYWRKTRKRQVQVKSRPVASYRRH